MASGNIQKQIQAVWLLGLLLSSSCIGNLKCRKDCIEYLFKTLGKLVMGMKSVEDENDPRVENGMDFHINLWDVI